MRFLNILPGTCIIAAPWILPGAAGGARWNDLIAGAALIALAFPRGPVREQYGGWDRFIA